ncbi:hypothetical protein DFQ27_003523 [Actinomortierella ambigua]|uniref:Cytochrome P450 n=1 Tax=Actinomortierella ambigua TaxID=1343610 RepID=A0A9P6Q4J4_9FUNG|nr:hypothetical protein DFQ27_003523 [Actinomortierella ambigua]
MAIQAALTKAYAHSTISLSVFLASVLTYSFYRTWLYPYHLDPLSRLPGPRPSRIPLLGNMLDLTRKKPMMMLYDWAMKYPGSLFRYYWFSRLTLLTSDPITVGYVLGQANDNWLKSKGTEKQFRQNLGESLLSMVGTTHTVHRRYLGQAFKHAYLKSMTRSFQGVAIDLVAAWENNTNEIQEVEDEGYTMIDLETWFYCLTLDSIGHFAMGQGFDAIHSPIGRDFDNYKIILESFQVTPLSLLPFSDWIPTKANRRVWKAIREFNTMVDELIQTRKHKLMEELEKNGGQFSTESGEDVASQKKDMLTMLLVDQLQGGGLDDVQMRHDIFTAIFAGHETTSAGLSWTFYQLARCPDIQQRLRTEVRQMFDACDGSPSFEQINNLPYLNAVLNLRVSVHDDWLPRGNGQDPLFVPAGTNLHLPMFILHRDHKIWGTDALRFRPDRWLPRSSSPSGGEKDNRPSPPACPPVIPPNGLCYFPFYHGKRVCIGNKMATLEMKVHIAQLVNRFEMVLGPELRGRPRKDGHDEEYGEDEDEKLDWRWSVSLKPSPSIKVGIRLAK